MDKLPSRRIDALQQDVARWDPEDAPDEVNRLELWLTAIYAESFNGRRDEISFVRICTMVRSALNGETPPVT